MTTSTVELPTPQRSKIAQFKIPTEQAHPFSESAVPFVDELISQNQALFEELAKLEGEQDSG